jgi:hypothetical protein
MPYATSAHHRGQLILQCELKIPLDVKLHRLILHDDITSMENMIFSKNTLLTAADTYLGDVVGLLKR